MIMPRKSGIEVYEEIRKQTSEVKVIFLSGYTADKIQQGGPPVGSELLQKPVSPQLLLMKMREAIDRK
jgi:polar amino acid transport system substrate-binding protein